MEMNFNIIIFIFCCLSFAVIQRGSSFVIECSHAFNLKTLDLARLLPLHENTNVTINNAFTAEIFVRSPCCQDILFESKGINCSLCSENGIKVCNSTEETIEIKRIEDEVCKRRSEIIYSCTSQLCPRRNNSEYSNEVNRPGDDTGCFKNGQNYICSKYGNWTEIPCKYKDTSNGNGVYIGPTSSAPGVSSDIASTEYSTEVYSKTTSTDISDILTTSSNFSVLLTISTNYSDVSTTLDTLNFTDLGTIDNTDATTNGLDTRNDTVATNFDAEKSMKALFTFLIVLGVVLFLVFILVCLFFIRKQRDKVTFSHVDYPLEYWHDKEYINSVVEKGFSTQSSYTLNPMYDNKGYVQKYKKKDESDYKKRKNNTTQDGIDERPRRSNAFRTRSSGSASSQGNTDRPRKTNHNYTDKFVATAVGSNFYNYSPSQSQDVVKKTTDLDVSTEDEIENSREPTNQPGTSSFRPVGNGKKKHRVTAGRSSDPLDDKYADVDAEDIYGANYKEHLRRSLEDWSAEESDA